MSVHGFPGYRQNDNFPSINEVLDGKGNTNKIRVNKVPDTEWKYSGGGYTVMEKLVEYGCGFNYVMTKDDDHQIKVRGGRMSVMALKLAVEQAGAPEPVSAVA